MPKGKVTVKKFSTLTKKEQLAVRKEAYSRWSVTPDESVNRLKSIANALGMTYAELKQFKVKDKWKERYRKENSKVNQQTKELTKKALEKANIENKKDAAKTIDEILDNTDVPDKWKLFIMHYLHCFNAYTAACKAGYSSKSNSVSHTILNDPRTKEAISKIKKVMAHDLNLTAHDLLDMYKSIAFADLTGVYEVTKTGWLKVRSLDQIDGRLIQEVKQGKDGIAIKLIDKKWALDKLEKLFDIIPDKRLILDNKRYELNKRLVEKQLQDNNSTGNKVVIINDL